MRIYKSYKVTKFHKKVLYRSGLTRKIIEFLILSKKDSILAKLIVKSI